MMVHEFSKYTILYTIFCRFCGIVWHCIISFSDMMLANVLNFRNFGMKWNCSVSKVVVPLSPLNVTDKTGQRTDKSHKFNDLWDFFIPLCLP